MKFNIDITTFKPIKFVKIGLLLSLLFVIIKGYHKKFFDIPSYFINRSVIELKPTLCNELQVGLEEIVYKQGGNWSITIINDELQIIGDINGDIPRIPASNQKLLSTAYVLDLLGPKATLNTQLGKIDNNSFTLVGEGDPDLDRNKIESFANSILNNLGIDQKSVELYLFEEPESDWWPKSWNYYDRLESYGAPITRLALTSNSLDETSDQNPLDRLSRIIGEELNVNGVSTNVQVISNNQLKKFSKRKEISVVNSAPMKSLLSLANSESHNFTAEVLMRKATNSWSEKDNAKALSKWIRQTRIPRSGFIVADASGLSRKNKVTSKGIATLLWVMDKHKYAGYYKSSMSISGIRGTLRNMTNYDELVGNFYGKTGTLNNVRSLSGYLNSPTGNLYVSLISNESEGSEIEMDDILIMLYRVKSC